MNVRKMGLITRAKIWFEPRANGLFPPTPEKPLRLQWLAACKCVSAANLSTSAPLVDGHSLTASPLITLNYLPEQWVFTAEWLSVPLIHGPSRGFPLISQRCSLYFFFFLQCHFFLPKIEKKIIIRSLSIQTIQVNILSANVPVYKSGVTLISCICLISVHCPNLLFKHNSSLPFNPCSEIACVRCVEVSN